jgi:hypothetical protein
VTGERPTGSAAGPGCELLVVHVLTDGRQPAELVSLTVLPVDRSGAVRKRLRWLVQPVRPLTAAQVYQLRINPNEQTAARPWEDIMDDVAAVLGSMPVLVYRGWGELCLLERHLPGWSPDRVHSVHRLARRLDRAAEIGARWRDAGCADASRAALLYRLFVELTTTAGHEWSTALSAADLQLRRYRPAPPTPGNAAAAERESR